MCQALAGRRVLVGCVTVSGGSWLDRCDPSVKGPLGGVTRCPSALPSWALTDVGRLLMPCRGVEGSAGAAAPVPWTGTSSCLLGLLPFLAFSQLGRASGPVACPEAVSCPTPPLFGVLEGVSGRALGPFLTQVQAPGSRAGNMECVCVCVQVWVSVCAYFACISREMRGWVGGGGQEEGVTLNTIPRGRNQEAGPVGRPLEESQHCGWGEAVLTRSKSWSPGRSGCTIVEGCPTCVC